MCYDHPTDPALCIKIPRNTRGVLESRREYNHARLVRFIHREDTGRHLTKFHGKVCTTEGIGWLVEKVLDELPGDLSSPLLADYLTQTAFNKEPVQWTQAYNEFMQWVNQTAIVIKDPAVSNICVRRLSSGQLCFVLIDGIAPKVAIPRLFPMKWYARYQNKKKIAERIQFASIENLIAFCQEQQADEYVHDIVPVDLPSNDVRLCFDK